MPFPTSRAARRGATAAVAAAALAVPAVAAAVNPGSATTGTGQRLDVRIDSPAHGATVPAADLAVTGVAGINALAGGPTNLMFIIDNSGSTSDAIGDCNGDGASNAGDDVNGDGAAGDVLDCEVQGIVALNASLGSTGAQAGIIAFGSAADQGDVSPAAGQQDFAATNADGDGNGRPDIEDVARSVTRSGIGKFTTYTTSGGGTNFNAALTRMSTAFATRAGQHNIAAFLSDGGASIDTSPGSPLDQAKAAGTRVNTFSIGRGGSGCGIGSSLKTIADTTGGTCTEVTDPTKLTASLAGAATGIAGVAVTVNGGTPIPATVGGLGAFTVTVPAARLRAGANVVKASATAGDGTVASADVTVNVGAKLSASSVIGLPSSRKCTSRRMFKIRIRQIAGHTYDFASIYVNGKRVRVYTRYKRRWVRVNRVTAKYLRTKVFTGYVDLRGLAKGRYKVKIVVVTTAGKVVTGTRRYRTCAKKLGGSVPRL